MNTIKIYVDNIRDVKEWSFDADCGFGMQRINMVTFTAELNSYGTIETKDHNCNEQEFERIKEEGYYYG